MTVRKLLNYWFGKKREGFYFFLAFLLAVCYLAALAIEQYQLTPHGWNLPMLLRTISFTGTLLLSLLVLAHLNIHACHEFLHLFQKQGHLPRKQIEHVNSFCMTVFLGLSLVGMVIFPFLLDPLWPLIAGWFRNLFQPGSRTAPLLEMEAPTPDMAPNLSELFGEPTPPPAWMEVLNRIFEILGYLLLILTLLFLVWTVLRMIWKWITKPRQFDDDEKIYLHPTLLVPSGPKKDDPSSKERGIRYFLSYNGKIRRLYRKRVLSGSRSQKTAVNISHFSWASPQELEEVSGLKDAKLHEIYEKARYGPGECTESDWKKLQP